MFASTRRPRGRRRPARSGAAAVEFAIVMLFILAPVMIGTWEVGRMILVQQIVANSAREGARLAAQAITINEDGSPTQIVTSVTPPTSTSTPGTPNVKAAAVQTLYGAGLTNLRWADVTCTFTFLDNPSNVTPAPTEPWQGVQGQRFRVLVSVPWSKVRWDALPGIVRPTAIAYAVECRILVDQDFSVNTTLPGVNPVP